MALNINEGECVGSAISVLREMRGHITDHVSDDTLVSEVRRKTAELEALLEDYRGNYANPERAEMASRRHTQGQGAFQR